MKNRVITISGVLGIDKCADIIAELF
jgi:hypothetical protein